MAVKAVFEADVANFQRGVQTAKQDLDSFNATLKTADVELDAFQKTADATGSTIASRLHTSIGQFDSLLRAAGYNIGVEARALQELAAAANQSFASLGALGTAGVVVGTALASWEIGTKIGELTGLTKATQDWIEELAGVKLKAWEASEGMRTLATASRLLGETVTNYAEAAKVIQASVGQLRLGELAKQWSDDIERLTKMGKLDEFTKAVDSHNFSVKQLADAYGLAVDSVAHFETELRASDKAMEDQNRATAVWVKGLLEAQDRWAAENKRGMDDWEKALERNYQMEMRLYLDAIKQQDILNEKVLKQFTQKELQTGLTITAGQEVAASNVARTQGAALPDAGLAAAMQLEKDIAAANKVYEDAAKAMGEVSANLRQAADELTRQAYLNYDVATRARRSDAEAQAATDGFTASLNKAAAANEAWINSLRQAGPRVGGAMFGEGETILPWSTLGRGGGGRLNIVPGSMFPGGPTSPINVNVSGIWDPATIRQMTDMFSQELGQRVGDGRPLPNY